MAAAANIKRYQFSLNFRELTLRVNIGKLITINPEKKTPSKNKLVVVYNCSIIPGKRCISSIKPNEAQKIPFAGMGSPLKNGSFETATLNLAKRKAPKTGIKKAENKMSQLVQ